MENYQLIGLIVLAVGAAYLVFGKAQNQAPIDWNSVISSAGDALNSTLDTFAQAITNFEGGPGDLNYRNNNPGNLRYANQPGTIGADANGFAIFDSWDSGFAALKRQIALDASRTPGWTITDFVNHYAPPSDNNPNNYNYANSIASALGVNTDTTLGELNLA